LPIAPNGITVVPLTGIPAVHPGDDLAGILSNALTEIGSTPQHSDVLVVAQKIVSKAEGAVIDLNDVTPGKAATELAGIVDKDPRLVEVILANCTRIVRSVPGVLITRTHHGYICANSGVDASNSLGPNILTLLPEDPDRSARQIRDGIEKRLVIQMAVIVSDSFNRPWRQGSINVAIGTAGFVPLYDGRGTADDSGQLLRATLVSVADEIASAAQLVMGETGRVPAALVQGVRIESSNEGSSSLLRESAQDLFR
jgi:coenzyme F420-0:L-glutamate ligase/coenzyme F420-1:gamma-L-glutamate ligase